eukprot:GHRQ01038537.1.p2 GENE.GHRQ01038537.1~~GHRQ01038537.1.p2  ORF type:complete len:107 (+),score=10.47 GHRQ01038537.1:784-1104(+)
MFPPFDQVCCNVQCCVLTKGAAALALSKCRAWTSSTVGHPACCACCHAPPCTANADYSLCASPDEYGAAPCDAAAYHFHWCHRGCIRCDGKQTLVHLKIVWNLAML